MQNFIIMSSSWVSFVSSSILIPVYFYLFLYHLLILGNSQPPYKPTEDILLNCGSYGNSTALDGRTWMGDLGSEHSNFFQQLNVNNNGSDITKADGQGSGIDPVPYLTARIFHCESTYTFPVTPGQKFIRLHFHPATYPNLNTSKAFFSVKTSNYTLLYNFSTSLTADYLQKPSFFKEFCVNVDGGNLKLSITFAPSPSIQGAYAFINGIEIVSMPTNLYYTGASDPGIKLIGHPHLLSIDNSTAMEMVYRLNVGGNSISPKQDSGMFRSWYQDDDYVLNKEAHPYDFKDPISFTKIPAYAAPEVVYRTARSLGSNKTRNMEYNLTWEMTVDSGFTYFVRLHLYGFQSGVDEENDRDFHIFINNLTTEDDVVFRGRHKPVPVYNDYAIMMGSRGKQSLFIALQPDSAADSGYHDAILNGIEVYKLSSPDGHLAGPNPEFSPPTSPTFVQQQPHLLGSSSSKSTEMIIFTAVSGTAVTVVVIVLFVVCSVARKRSYHFRHRFYCKWWWWRQLCWDSLWWNCVKQEENTKSTLSLPRELCRRFTLAEIQTATDNFDDDRLIGEGGFGKVYKGFMVNYGGTGTTTTTVAIKRMKSKSKQGAREFWTEIEMVSKLRHLHLLSLTGYCNERSEMILVYDYMANGTLRDHLYGSGSGSGSGSASGEESRDPPLPWERRLQICIGAAKGLHHLHTGAERTIIHRDVKTTNILLDDKWVAKVSDFGLSKVGPTATPNVPISTLVKGTFGYMDPEYFRYKMVTEKSDVYSFGVVLLEVLCGRAAVDMKLEFEQASLANWARRCMQEGALDRIIDPFLRDKVAPECLSQFSEIAESCLREQGMERPSMDDVVRGLELAMQLQSAVGVWGPRT